MNQPQQILEQFANATTDLFNHVTNVTTLEDMETKIPTYSELIARIPPETVETLFSELGKTLARYNSYFNESDNVPPGVPRH